MTAKLRGLEEEVIVLVEGESDQALLNRLLANRGLVGFQVVAPKDLGAAGGVGSFTHMLNAITTLDGFEQLRGIIIVSDNDDDPEQSFAQRQQSIRDTEEFGDPSRRFPVPDEPDQVAAGAPPVAIRMVPEARVLGNLETLCIRAARENYPDQVDCVEELVQCGEIEEWAITRLSKSKVRSVIAITHEERPDASFAQVIDEAPALFPVGSDVFNGIADFFRRLHEEWYGE
jgi:hypothetical protein